MSGALKKRGLFFTAIAVDGPLQQDRGGPVPDILLGNVLHFGQSRLTFCGSAGRPVVTADGFERLARGKLRLPRFHQAFAHRRDFLACCFVARGKLVRVGCCAFVSQFRD